MQSQSVIKQENPDVASLVESGSADKRSIFKGHRGLFLKRLILGGLLLMILGSTTVYLAWDYMPARVQYIPRYIQSNFMPQKVHPAHVPTPVAAAAPEDILASIQLESASTAQEAVAEVPVEEEQPVSEAVEAETSAAEESATEETAAEVAVAVEEGAEEQDVYESASSSTDEGTKDEETADEASAAASSEGTTDNANEPSSEAAFVEEEEEESSEAISEAEEEGSEATQEGSEAVLEAEAEEEDSEVVVEAEAEEEASEVAVEAETEEEASEVASEADAQEEASEIASEAEAAPEAVVVEALHELPAPEALLKGVRHEFQGWNNCGPATLGMQLSYFGRTDTQEITAPFLKPDESDKNVGPDELAAYAEHIGYGGQVVVGGDLEMLRTFITNGFPVIVESWFIPDPDDQMGHYLLLTGYEDDTLTFFDSYHGPDVQEDSAEFDELWKVFNRTAVVVWPPEQEALATSILGDLRDPEMMHQQALAVAHEEVNANPQDKFAWFNLGSNLMALGDTSNAVKAFDTARSLELPWRMLWYQFGPYQAYYESGQYEEVISLTTTTLDSSENLEESLYWRGMAHAALGDTEAARSDFEQAVAYNYKFTLAQEALDNLQ